MTNGAKVITGGIVVAVVVGIGALIASAPAPQYSDVEIPVEQSEDCPAATAYVQDCADVLNAEQQASLEKLLSDYDASTTNQIAVVTVKSLRGQDIESYSIKLAEELKVGRADIDNGVIFLIAVNDHKMRIEVGHGVEGDLTDAESGDIIRNDVAPKFRSNDFPGGIMAGVDAIISQLPNNK